MNYTPVLLIALFATIGLSPIVSGNSASIANSVSSPGNGERFHFASHSSIHRSYGHGYRRHSDFGRFGHDYRRHSRPFGRFFSRDRFHDRGYGHDRLPKRSYRVVKKWIPSRTKWVRTQSGEVKKVHIDGRWITYKVPVKH